MATTPVNTKPTLRRFRDGDAQWKQTQDKIHDAGFSHQCPTYIVATPPCQANCPSGEDIRGAMNIARGIEKPPVGADGKPIAWQEYAWQRITQANPFPAIMGRCCPAPCEAHCNRAKVEDHVGCNAVEHFVGNYAIEKGLAFAKPQKETGKRIAVIGGGVGGLSCAYHLRRKGHAVVVFEAYKKLGGMMAFGLPSYRADHAIVDKEIQRILDMGVEVRLNTRVGKGVSFESLKREFDAIFVAIGAQSGNRLEVPGADAPNCIEGLKFLRDFNEGRLADIKGPVVVIGGGNTAMDVAAVALRSGIVNAEGRRGSAKVVIAYRRTIPEMPADEIEINGVLREGAEIQTQVIPVSVVKGADGKATALRVARVEWVNKKMVVKEGTHYDIPCALIVAATGQAVEWDDMGALKNARNLASIDGSFQAAAAAGVFIGGDAVVPDLLTTAIGHGRIAAEGIDDYVSGRPVAKRPKVDKMPFDVPGRMVVRLEAAREPMRGTFESNVAVHNYDSRCDREVVAPEQLFLGHFSYAPRNVRALKQIDAANVLGNMDERMIALTEAQVQAEAKRCMSCGVCFECDNCVIYCPQEAVHKVPKGEASIGRYVYTEYKKCIGCAVCMDVCPTGYIRMGLGE